MMTKRTILILAPLAVAGFAGAFFLSGMFGIGDAAAPSTSAPDVPAAPRGGGDASHEARAAVQAVPAPREQLLDQLIKDIRAKTAQRDRELKRVRREAERLELARRELDASLKRLRELRTEITEAHGKLSARHTEIKTRLVRIDAVERRNLKEMAGVYDRMDSTAAGQIIAQWCEDGRLDDAVKLLHFMGDRQAAGLLAAITDKSLAAKLTDRLKAVQDEARQG